MHCVSKAGLFLKKLSRYQSLTDGAKVTLLEFLYHFWTRDKEMPSYTELSKARNVARSTIQAHIEELEKSGILISVRLPNNRKQYRLCIEAVDKSVKLVAKPKKTAQPAGKSTSKYSTSELCRYFYFKFNEMAGCNKHATRPEYNRMRVMHRRHGASEIIKAIDRYLKSYKRRGVPFTLDYFLEHVDVFVSTK